MPLGTPFIAMTLVAGTPLSALPFITPEVRAAAAAALRQIHAAGVAHGDLRRANMLVERLPRHSSSSSADTQLLSTAGSGDIGGLLAEAAGGGGGAQSHRAGPGSELLQASGVRVVIVDLGHAQINASRARLQEEAHFLQRLLR